MSDSVGGVAEQEPDPTQIARRELAYKAAYDLMRYDSRVWHEALWAAIPAALAAADAVERVRADLLTTRTESERLRKHSQTHRGEMSGYTVGEVEYVESQLRKAEAERDALQAALTEIRTLAKDGLQRGIGIPSDVALVILDRAATMGATK